jgi:hypothetical protein
LGNPKTPAVDASGYEHFRRLAKEASDGEARLYVFNSCHHEAALVAEGSVFLALSASSLIGERRAKG